MKLYRAVTCRVHILLGLFIAHAAFQAQGADEPSLAQRFCAEWATRLSAGVQVQESDLEWATFVQRLESREPASSTGLQRVIVQRCLEQNRADLDRGAFLLDGLRLLEDALMRHQTSRNRVAAVEPPVSGTVSLPDFGEVPLIAQRQVAGLGVENSLRDRRDRYAALWEAFVADLRKTMTERRRQLKMGQEVSR